jgi:hypothetical protein
MVSLSGMLLNIYIKSVQQSMTFLFSQEVTLAFFQTFFFLNNAFLHQFLVVCIALCESKSKSLR